VVLIVEDDSRFAAILLSLVRDAGFKGIVTGEGQAVPSLARRFGPDVIMLDVGLPDMDGLALLDRLKRTPETRHIPVHVISADDQAGLGLSMGAVGFTSKPVEKEAVVSTLDTVKRIVAHPAHKVAVVGVEGAAAEALRQAFAEVTVYPNLAATLRAWRKKPKDCVVIDAGHVAPADLVEQLRGEAGVLCPVVVYAPDELAAEDDKRLRLAVFGGLARLARSTEQLVDQTCLLLHEPVENLSAPAKAMLNRIRREDALLTGRTAVVIDDDIRNIFSLASALEEYGITLHYAESGRAGLELMDSLPAVDMVLVDIMMPDMDGYETMREIRARARFADLPVIAVTAKAMKGDRQKCIQAGASDYVSKPVDIDQLISVLRVSVQRTDAMRLAADSLVVAAPVAG
jgi:CheY-like chemotaxis protein